MPALSYIHHLFDIEKCQASIHTLRGKDRSLHCPRCQSKDIGFVKLLRLRCPSGKRVPLPGPIRPLGGLLRACHFGPTRESLLHLLTIVGR